MALAFLGIGSTRSGTTFLHEHLRAHPRIWLPPQKEIHYFNVQRSQGFWNRRHLKHVRNLIPNALEALGGKRGVSGELRWQLKYLLGRRDDAWFLSLYEGAPGLVMGQIEPTYATLPPQVIRVVHELVPQVKLLYMMRDPIDRAWSSVTKSRAKNKGRPMERVPEREIFEKIDRSAVAMSRYIHHIECWEEVFPKESFFFGFFDEILEAPGELLNRALSFLGIEPLMEGGDAGWEPVNDTRLFKVDIPPHVERYLAEHLIEPTRALERRFGGYTRGWLERMERVLSRDAGAQPPAAVPER
jgi:hypothetical protein